MTTVFLYPFPALWPVRVEDLPRAVRERDALTFYCLQLTSPQDKGLQNIIKCPSRTATCKNHVVPSKGIGNMDNKTESSARAVTEREREREVTVGVGGRHIPAPVLKERVAAAVI